MTDLQTLRLQRDNLLMAICDLEVMIVNLRSNGYRSTARLARLKQRNLWKRHNRLADKIEPQLVYTSLYGEI